MNTFVRSLGTATSVALAIQCFTIGVLSPRLPREVCRPCYQDQRSLSFPAAPLLDIDHSDGGVRVTTHEEDRIALTVDIRAYTSTADERGIAEAYVAGLLQIAAGPDEIQVVTEPGDRPDELDLRVDYTIRVPDGTDLRVLGANGNVSIGAGCGRIWVAGNNTDIEIYEPAGGVEARSTNGRISVYDATERTVLSTVNGNVYAESAGGAIEASTTNGAIVATLRNPVVESCELTVTNGNITLALAEGCSAQVDAHAGRGAVRSDLPLDGLLGVQRRREVHGRIGEGHTRLRMESLNGNIWITRNST